MAQSAASSKSAAFVQSSVQSSSGQSGTREKLLGCLDDIELVTRVLLENVIAPKGQQHSGTSYQQLTELLLKKDADLKELLTVAEEQQEVHKQMEQLKQLVDEQDRVLTSLQRSLKDAETRLANAIYQANQKLESIKRSQQRPVKAEALIHYAHRISSTNAVSAPLTWQQGDPRRPYPTEVEMRRGLLGRLMDMPVGGHALHQPAADSQPLRSSQEPAPPPPPPPASTAGAAGQFHWTHGGGEVHMSVPGGGSVPLGKQTAGPQEVEVMSTDSSSSSSSDSQ